MPLHYQADMFDDEWDKVSHTLDDYRKEVRQLRERCAAYAKELDELRLVVKGMEVPR